METVDNPIQLSSSEEMVLRTSHLYRHEVCPEDSEWNQSPRPLVRRAARGIMQFEHTAEKIVGWLKETEIENSQFIPNDVTGAGFENGKSVLNVTGCEIENSTFVLIDV